MIICYTVHEIWHVMDVNVIFHFGLYFSLYHPNSPKNENFKKMKKTPGDIIFYTTVPKIMIICYTVPEIRHVADVIAISYLQFLALLPPNSPKN